MKRILHVMGGMNRAGAESMIMTLYRELDKEKYQFDFLVYKNEKQDYEEEIIKMGGRVIHLPQKSGILGLINSIYEINRVIKEFGPYEAIHIATLHNSAFSLLASLPYRKLKRIVHSHNTSNVVNPNLSKKIYNWITTKVIRNLSQYKLACGKEAGEYLFGKKQFDKDGIIINNSVNVEELFHIQETQIKKLKSELNISNELIIGSIARLDEVKNHHKMIEIASELKKRNISFKMLFIGRGDLEESLKRKVKEKGLKEVIFLGVRTDIPELLHCMDLFLMPSFFEGNPVTLVEAQAAGTPALISSTITDKIDLKLGLIERCDINDSTDVWVDRILSITKPNLEFEDIKKAFTKYGYDIKSSLEKLIEVYTR